MTTLVHSYRFEIKVMPSSCTITSPVPQWLFPIIHIRCSLCVALIVKTEQDLHNKLWFCADLWNLRTKCSTWRRRCSCSIRKCSSSWRRIWGRPWRSWIRPIPSSARRTRRRPCSFTRNSKRLRNCSAPSRWFSIRQRTSVLWRWPDFYCCCQYYTACFCYKWWHLAVF